MEPTLPRFPKIEVRLSGADGNAFVIIGKSTKVLERGLRKLYPEIGPAERSKLIVEFGEEIHSGDYDNVLQTVFRWMEVS